jgi:hypothetical protein
MYGHMNVKQLHVLFVLEYALDCLHVSTITVTFRRGTRKCQDAVHLS